MNRAVHFLLWFCFLVLLPVTAFSQERLTITTYYPSPVGSYADLNTNQMKVGSAYAGFTGPANGLIVQGNVGIGTSIPQSRVHIAGGLLELNVQGAAGSFSIPNTCGGSWVTGVTSGIFAREPAGGCGDEWYIASYPRAGESRTLEIGMKNDADDHIALMPSANVGIGTTAPGTKLSVRVDGDGANAVLRLSSILANWTAGFGPRLLFHGGSDDRSFGEIGSFLQNTGTGANAYMTFSTRDSETVAERVRITSSGNVGISTNAPAGRFQVSATVTDAGIFGTAVGNAFVIWPDGNAGNGPALMYPSALSLRIGTITGFGAAGWTERMRVNSSGNLGIGTNNPDCTLHTSSTLAGAGAATRIASGHIQNTAAGNWANGLLVETANNTANAYLIHGWAGGALKFAVYANGGMTATGLSAAAGPDTVRYNNLTGLFSYVVSSRRYKDKIQPLQDDFSKILKVEPQSFVYKADGRPDIGYIAEDLDEIGLKKLVNYDKEGQPNSIQYDKIPLYILEVVKTQQKEIDSLKQELAQIKAKLK